MEEDKSLTSGASLFTEDSRPGMVGLKFLCTRVIRGRPPKPLGAEGLMFLLLRMEGLALVASTLAEASWLAMDDLLKPPNLFLLEALAANRLFSGLIPAVMEARVMPLILFLSSGSELPDSPPDLLGSSF